MMTARERLFAALRGEPTDRVPIWLLFPYHATGYYVDVRHHPQYRPVFEASKQYAVMLNRRNPGVPIHTPDVTHQRETLMLDGVSVVRNAMVFGGESIYSQVGTGDQGAHTKKLLNTPEDLEFYCSLPIDTDRDRIVGALDRQLPRYLEEKAEFPEAYGSMMLDLGEPINPLYRSADLEEYAIWSLTHRALIEDFLDRLMVQYRIIYQYCLERDLADVYFMVGSELASPPLVSRETFQRWIVPYAKELNEMVHSYGKHVIQHYHGQIKEIMSDFMTMGPDALHTIEAPPIGNCTFTEAFDVVGDGMTLIGNIQYDDFRAFSEAEMKQAVIDVLDECRGKRLILSPSAGPFDEEVSDAFIRNYMTFMETAWAYEWA